jgi:FAD/FMN-containing dehydrogenase
MPDVMANIPNSLPALRERLREIVGADHVSDDARRLDLHSADIWAHGAATVELIVAPRSLSELSDTVAAATAAGYHIAPRGAGMSYTGGYVAEANRTISLDLSAMNRILAIRPEDMVVTV